MLSSCKTALPHGKEFHASARGNHTQLRHALYFNNDTTSYFYYIYTSYIWISYIMGQVNAVSQARLVFDVICLFECEMFAFILF